MPVRHLVIANGGTGTRIASIAVDCIVNDLGQLPTNIGIAVIDARRRPEENVGTTNVDVVEMAQPLNYVATHNRMMTDSTAFRPQQLRSWWPKHMHPSPKVTFIDGCGADRPTGRFFATQYDAEISRTIQTALNRLRSIGGAAGVEPLIHIYICASLGNGTGGGSFMQVATIAHDLASRSGLSPQILGIFVPSTATATAVAALEDRILKPRIGANGVASLIELQYEFNRRRAPAATKGAWTRQPRREDGPLEHHGVHSTYSCADVANSPFAAAMVVDIHNSTGHVRTYPQVVGVAGRALYAMLTGADADNRILDTMRNATGPFGSVGFMRVRSPMVEARAYMTLKIRKRLAAALEQSSATEKSTREQEHDLLRLSIGNQRAENGTIDASVEFFVRTIAQIHEADHEDQLLDRLREVLPADPFASRNTSTPKVPSEMDEFRASIEAHLRNCQKRVDEMRDRVLNGSGPAVSVADLAKLNPEQRMAAERAQGVRKLLALRVIDPLVAAGEFGLLIDWLEALKSAVSQCGSSVNQTELSRVRESGARPGSEVDEWITKAQEYHDHWLSMIFGSKKGDLLEAASSRLTQYMRDGRELITAASAINLYEALDADLDAAMVVLRNVRDTLAGELYNNTVARDLDNATGVLVSGSRVDPTLELVLGGIDDVDLAVDEAMEAPSSASNGVRAAVRELAAHHHAIVAWMGTQLGLPGITAAPPSAPRIEHGWAQAYVGRLTELVEQKTNDLLVAHLSLANLLEARCRRVVRDYVQYGLYAQQGGSIALDAVAQNAIKVFRDLLGEAYNHITQDMLKHYDRQNRTLPEHVFEDALAAAIQAKLLRLNGKAVVCWMRNRDAGEFTGRHSLLVLRSGNSAAVRKAIAAVAETAGLHINDRTTNDPNRIDFVTLETGAYLEELTMSLIHPHKKHYQESLNPSSRLGDNFSPHTSQQYIEVGRSFLAFLDGDKERSRNGAALLALALWQPEHLPGTFGFITEASGGRFTVGRPIKSGNTVVAAKGRALDGQGIAAAIAALNLEGYDASRDDQRRALESSQRLRDALSDELWDELRALLFGDGDRPDVKPIGVVMLCEHLTQYAAELETRSFEAGNAVERGEALSRQSAQLRELAAALQTSRGNERPSQLSP